MLNLLSDELLRFQFGAKVVAASLPELLAHLVADSVESLPALRPHQKQPLHCFLAQIGALALLAGVETEPPHDAAHWKSLLRGLTPNFANDEPWTLVVDDLSKPAFLQPPVPEGKWEVLKKTEPTPDALDMLVTSKSHDLKSGMMANALPEHWVFALLALQTLQGVLGRGNYGISRMNSGHASRPFVGAKPEAGGWGAHVTRDMRALVLRRARFLEDNPMYPLSGGHALVWLEPWNGETALTPEQLDPYYIEVCRRIRLRRVGNTLSAHRGSSKASRIDMPDALLGATGDPWTPISRGATPKPLTVDGDGFHYKRIVDLIDDGKYRFAPLQVLDDDEAKGGVELVFVVTVRGEGETQGFHERRIHVPPRAVPFFRRTQTDSRLATLGRDRIVNAAALSSKALRPALFTLLQGAPDKLDFKDPKAKGKADVLLARFEQRVDADFFERLFDELTDDPHSAPAQAKRRAWLLELETHARDILAIAESGSPLSFVRRYRARAAAESVLAGAIRNHFKDIVGVAP